MKTRILILGLLLISLAGYTQDQTDQQVMTKKEQKQLAKEQRDEMRKAEEESNKQITDSILHQRQFVLEADYISGRTGVRTPVTSMLNFIMVDSADVVMQLGNPSGVGYNGVGGITVEGNITKYELYKKEGKKGDSYNLTLYIMSNLGIYDVQMWISGTGQADATVRGTSRGELTYSGRLVPINKSRVYKARTI
jgi:hypothetical protein